MLRRVVTAFLAAGNITYNAVHPTEADTRLFTGGALTVEGRALQGQLLTGNISTDMHVQGFAPTDDLLFLTSDDGSSEPDRQGLLVGVRQGGNFGLSDLASSTWRFKALGASSFLEQAGWAIGSLTLAANATVTGGFVEFADHTSATIPAQGAFAIDAGAM